MLAFLSLIYAISAYCGILLYLGLYIQYMQYCTSVQMLPINLCILPVESTYMVKSILLYLSRISTIYLPPPPSVHEARQCESDGYQSYPPQFTAPIENVELSPALTVISELKNVA